MNWWQTFLWWVVLVVLLGIAGIDLNLVGCVILGVAVGVRSSIEKHRHA